MQIHLEELDRIEVPRDETGLFERFAKRRRFGTFVRVDVAARLNPDTEEPVAMQDDPARRHHEGRGGEVVKVLLLGERIARPDETFEGSGD
jgi:hypothetical protein